MAKAPTSYIATAGAARTRTADSLTFPLATRPQAMTLYLRFVELSNPAASLPTWPLAERLFRVGGTSNPGWDIYRSATAYVCSANNGVTQVNTSVSAATVSTGDLVEIAATLTTTGVVQIFLSVNGGSLISGTASSALAMPAAWFYARIDVGALTGTLSAGPVGVRDLLLVRGVHSLAAMRVRIGLTP